MAHETDDDGQAPESLLPYELWTEQAMRQVMRDAINHVARDGLPPQHHFYITLRTDYPGVVIPPRLRAQYPEEMTVILQHQFWDLTVTEQAFDVGLSFGGITERLGIPFDAITAFVDPSVQFGLQFEEVVEGQMQQAPANPPDKAKEKQPAKAKRFPSALPGLAPEKTPTKAPEKPAAAPPALSAVPDPKPDKPSGGGEVVRLDRFRKK